MASNIHKGSRGETAGPLKPAGRICVNGLMFDACSEGEWIDAGVCVVVTGSRSQNLVVRPLRVDDPPAETLAEILPLGHAAETTPLHAPPSLVERFNAIAAGAVVGCILVPLAWLCGTPLSISALLVPAAGAAAGLLFQWFVKGALQSVGPREDHRPRSFEIAAIVTGSAAIGAFVGVSIGFGFLGLSAGLVIGALVGGFISWIGLLVSSI